MKSLRALLPLPAVILALTTAPLNAQPTNSIPPGLRNGNFECDQATIQAALELKVAGWSYIMPEPKSAGAAWGNPDRRTTWWVGYWMNKKTKDTSLDQPKKGDGVRWAHDGKGLRAWRQGGSPGPPTKIEWLCSESGGISPR